MNVGISVSTKKSYWLYLHPYVHINIKKNWAVLYNTITGKILEYKGNSEVLNILRRLNRGLYVTGIRGNEITTLLFDFISQCRQFFFGDIVDKALSQGKPFQAKPTLRLIKALNETTFKATVPFLERDEAGDYLNTINLFINNSCGQDCSICGYAYKQFFNCTSGGNHQEELDIDIIDAFLDEAGRSTSLYKANILGGNILHYSKLEGLVNVLQKYQLLFEYYINYRNISQDKERNIKKMEQAQGTLHVLINPPVSKDCLECTISLLLEVKIPVVYQFIVEEERDFESAMDIISYYRIENYEFTPAYNGQNENFFRENLFITKSAISKAKPSRKNIYARMSLNALFFKSLIIKSDYSVYANLYKPSIGKLGRHSVFEMIRNELDQGTAWNRIRQNVIPCKSCPYNAICPPISNYEFAFEKYNLCNILGLRDSQS